MSYRSYESYKSYLTRKGIGGGVWESNPTDPKLSPRSNGFEVRAGHQTRCASAIGHTAIANKGFIAMANEVHKHETRPIIELFEAFILERQMLYNASPNTVKWYWAGLRAFTPFGHPTTLHAIQSAMVQMRQAGLGIGGVNAYVRAWQSFCNWLADRGHIAKVRIPEIPQPRTIKTTLTADHARAILRIRLRTSTVLSISLPALRRVHTMFTVALDTAIRWGELVSLTRSSVDSAQHSLTVRGKTGERIVSVSSGALRAIERHLTTHRHGLAFCTRNGKPLDYSDSRRDLRKLFTLAGVPEDLAEWHSLR